jgi:hypothetical protein
MGGKPSFAFGTRSARPSENALVSAYMTATDILCPFPSDTYERAQVLTFLLDEICRSPCGEPLDKDALVAAALAKFGRGFASPN